MTELPIEIEAKFLVASAADLRSRLAAINAVLTHPERQLRRVLFLKKQNPQLQGDYLRVRDEGDVIRMSLKIHAQEGDPVATQRELDITTSDFDRSVELLKNIGCTATNYQENLRETWMLDGSEIVIDTWPGLDPYVEIEAPSENDLRRIAESLGFDWEKRIVSHVAHIYAITYGIPKERALELLAHCTFEENPFAGLHRENPL